MTTYKVQGDLSWVSPMLVFVENGVIVGQQQNPNNDLTKEWFEEGEEYPFNPSDWASCERC